MKIKFLRVALLSVLVWARPILAAPTKKDTTTTTTAPTTTTTVSLPIPPTVITKHAPKPLKVKKVKRLPPEQLTVEPQE